MTRTCTCYPDADRPFPCPEKFAASECQHAHELRKAKADGVRLAAGKVTASHWLHTELHRIADAIERGEA